MRNGSSRIWTIVSLAVAFSMIASVASAAVYTDKYEYDYGETVQITGGEMVPGEAVSVDVSYPEGGLAQNHVVTADESGSFEDTFVLEDGMPGGIYLVTASGLVSGNVFTVAFDPAVATLSTMSIAFGNASVGSQSPAETVGITNTGDTNMNVQSITLTGADPSQFILNTAGAVVNGITPGSSVSFTVRFAPTTTGLKAASVQVNTNGNDPSVALTGTGVAADVTAPAVTISNGSGSGGTDSSAPIDVVTNSNPTITWSANESGTYAVKSGTCTAGTTLTGTNTSGSYTAATSITSTINLSGLSEGTNTARVCVTDAATNTGSDNASIFKDTVAPDTTIDTGPTGTTSSSSATFTFHADDPAPSSGGITFECKIDVGSFSTCESGDSFSVGEGPHSFHVTSRDAAGNQDGTPASQSWVIDTIDPVVTISSASGSASIDNTSPFDVVTNDDPTITWSANESGTYALKLGTCGGSTLTGTSTTGSYTAPDSITSTIDLGDLSEGANTVRACVTDAAGNTGHDEASAIKDTVAPEVSVNADRAPDHNGWYNAAVTFSTNGTDATSGIDTCIADQVYTGPDGTDLTVSGSCTDQAGNVGNSTSDAFDFDNTDPSVAVTPDRAPDHNGWYNAPVTFDTAGTDTTSEIDTCTADQVYTGPDGTDLTVGGSCTDAAGNVGNGTSEAFDFDDTDPSVAVTPNRPSDHNGWYNAPVTFDTAGTDATSGIDTCTADQVYTGPDGTGLTTNGSCTDQAGNTGNGTSDAFDYDDTDPVITLITPPDGASYALNQPVAADYQCSDVTSLIDTCVGTVADGLTIDTGSVGAKSFAVNAQDQAGNTASSTNDYDVAYVITGFFQPVDNVAVNSAKAGQAVPVKWRLTDYFGAGISSTSSFVSVTSISGAGSCSGLPTDAIEDYAGSSGLQYLGDGYWQYNWKTPKSYVGQCRTMKLNLAGGQQKTASFQFK